MIHFLTHVFKQLQCYSMYWALEDARAVEQVIGKPMAYYHMTRDANCVAHDMARRALEARATTTLWDGHVPKDAPGNQLQDVYKQKGIKPQLD